MIIPIIIIIGSTITTAIDATGSKEVVLATGLRFQTLSAFITLHFIGHRRVTVSPSIWKWSLATVCEAHGHPIQSIALAALARLAFLAQVRRKGSFYFVSKSIFPSRNVVLINFLFNIQLFHLEI